MIAITGLIRVGFQPWFPLGHDVLPPLTEGFYKVELVDRGRIRLRGLQTPPIPVDIELLGVDLSGPLEDSASRFLRASLLGNIVRIRLDRRRTNSRQTRLAYVYFDDELVNARLVRRGLAKSATCRGDCSSISREIKAAEQDAKSAGDGIWRQPAH